MIISGQLGTAQLGAAQLGQLEDPSGSGSGNLTGSTGITSGEAFGTTGKVNLNISGTSGIVSAETFGLTGTIGQPIGVNGIPSEEAFGTNGTVIGGEGAIAGSAGIVSGEAFGTNGQVNLTVTGASGIVTAEAFGTNGNVIQFQITGITGIPSAEAFGATGTVTFGIQGNNGGIRSAEAFGTTGTVLRAQAFTLFIGGIDRTSLLKADSMNVNESLATPGTTAQFTLEDPSGTVIPQVGQEVIYYRNAVRHFGGTIETSDVTNWIGSTQNSIQVHCNDWATICNRHVIGAFLGFGYRAAQPILTYIAQNYLALDGITYDTVDGDSGVNIGDQTFNWITVTEALNIVSKASGWAWRIDYYKVLRQFPANLGTGSAPFSIADNDGKWRNMRVQDSRGQYRNRQGVRSSQQLLILSSDTFSGTNPGPFPNEPQFTNGVQRFFTTSQLFNEPPAVSVNGVTQVVAALDEIPSSPGWQWYWIKGGVGVGQNPTAAALTSADTLVVSYRSTPPPIVWVQDNAAIAARAALEGNSGIYEAVLDAPNVTDLVSAQQLAAAELARYGGAAGIPRNITIETDTNVNSLAEGLQVGQILPINTTRPTVSGSYLITQLVMKEVGKQYLNFMITCVSGDDQRTSYAQQQAAIIARTKLPIPRQIEQATIPLFPGATGWAGGAYTQYPYIIRNSGTLRDVTIFFNARPLNALTGFLRLNGTNIGGFTYPQNPLDSSPTPVLVIFQFSPVRITVKAGDLIDAVFNATDGHDGVMNWIVDI